MRGTCADCKYHLCHNTCIYIKNRCNGYCKISKRHKNCYGARCKNFELDEYFKK